jgi:hypothetical protein
LFEGFMDFHEALKTIGGILVLLLFIPMFVTAAQNGGAGQSFAMWFLWTALDLILTLSLYEQHGNFLVPLGFAIGDAFMAVLLLIKGRFIWRRFEIVILALVLACLAGWKLGGANAAIVAATLGICIAGVPGLVELWKNPQRRVGNIWAAYVVANGIAFWGGDAMTLEERFAPGVFAGHSLLMFLASRRRVTERLLP